MFRLVAILLLSLSLHYSSASAAQGALIGLALKGDENASVPSTDTVPNPLKLEVKWSNYLDVEDEVQYKNRLKDLETLLANIQKNSPEKDLEITQPLINRLMLNLNTLFQARAQKSIEQAKLGSFYKDYSLDQLLEVFYNVRLTNTQVENEEEDLKRINETISQTLKQLDTLLASYLTLTENSPEKLATGLRLMLGWSSVEIAKEKQRIHKAHLDITQETLKQFNEELKVAKANLQISPNLSLNLEAEINSAQRRLSQAQNTLLRAETRILESFPDTPVSRAKNQQLTQEVILASTLERMSRLELLFLESKKDLYFLNLKFFNPNENELNTQNLQLRSDLLKEVKANIVEWSQTSEKEFERANQAYLDQSALKKEENQDLLLIHKKRIDLAQETLSEIQKLHNLILSIELFDDIIKTSILKKGSTLENWTFRVSTLLKDFWSYGWGSMQFSLFKIGDVPITPQGIMRMLIIFFVALWVSRLVQAAIKRIAEKQWRIAKTTFYTLGRLAHYSILSLGLILSLGSLGINFNSLALVAGALSVGIGFGLQSIVNNFVSGLIIFFETNLKIGDLLELESGYKGYISEINVRSSIIRTNDGIEVIIPNSELISNRVINWTMSDAFRRIHVPFGVAYGTDKELVKMAVLEAADKVPHTLKGHVKYQDPKIRLVEFGDSAVKYSLVVWVDARATRFIGSTISDYLWEIESSLSKYNISIPFPQRDLHIKSVPGDFTKIDRETVKI